MNRMIVNAKGNPDKIASIKEKQLIGVEWQDDIFALACSNMFIHGDGKTNIVNGDCFDPLVAEIVAGYKPNIGFLNPPYKTKKTDIEELEFVLNNLDLLETNGTCLAIIPISCLLATNGSPYELKKELLSRHTLEAVFSMPDELFINSKVGVVTCIMVVTAHKPHPKNKETFFGYWKDDGFVKRKNKGRVDAFGKWEKIREEWLNSYMNRTSKPGMGANHIVGPDDEWCAEAYMETDYSYLNDNDFLITIRDYSSFLVKNNVTV